MMAVNGRKQGSEIYKRQMKLQESARELNKREQRKFDLEMESKGGIAAEYKFKMEKVNHEQRIIEKELEQIRRGVHRHPGHFHTLNTDRKFHHPQFSSFGGNKAFAASLSARNTHPIGKEKGREKSSEDSIDAMALVQYLQDFNKNYAEKEERGPDKHVKSSGPCQPNQLNVTKHPTPDEYPSILSNQIKSSQPENLIPSNEQDRSEGRADESQSIQENELRSNKYSSEEPLRQQMNTYSKSADHRSMNANLEGKEHRKDGNVGRRASLPNSPSVNENVVSHNAQKDVSHNTQRDAEKDAHAGTMKKGANQQTTDEVKKLSLSDPENYNPDGSIKTAYTVPSFEKRWEEAKKARYIRTKEPLDRDRQLTAKEIFDKNG